MEKVKLFLIYDFYLQTTLTITFTSNFFKNELLKKIIYHTNICH